MKYKKQLFGHELKKRLLKKQNIHTISLWLYDSYINFSKNEDPLFKELLYELMMMDSGPEFELSYVKLKEIADQLIANEDVRL